jgi:hypothetical protein
MQDGQDTQDFQDTQDTQDFEDSQDTQGFTRPRRQRGPSAFGRIYDWLTSK